MSTRRVPALPVPLLACLLVVAAVGVAYGVFTDRWGPSGQLERAVGALPRVPAEFGDWVGEDVAHDPADMARAGIKGSVYRRYRNPRTGESVSFLIVCGRGGPITVHTPDVCYAGAGYRPAGPERVREIDLGDGAKDSFKVARFGMPGGVLPTQLEIYWAWSRDGVSWQAPENPRLSFARFPALYKMYVVREFAPGSRSEGADACDSFLRRALPSIRQALPPSGG